jgi:hypothetical protein
MRAATIVALVAVGVSATACAPSAMPATSAKLETPVAPSVVASDAGSVDAGDAVDASAMVTLDALAARATSVAAGMREAARGEIAGDAAGATNATTATRVIARADDRDVCVRVTMVARPAAHAWLADTRGDVLSDAAEATDATLGARGPVCVRKGDVVSLHLESKTPFVARFVAWQSP